MIHSRSHPAPDASGAPRMALVGLAAAAIAARVILAAPDIEGLPPAGRRMGAMFCLAIAVVKSGLDRRFARWLLRRAGTDSRRVVVALMVGAAATSTIMSDVPACVIFMAVGLGIMTRAELRPESRFGHAVMIGIPIAALIGGVATPAGSSVNILGIHFIEEYGHVRVPFVEWMIIEVPMVVVLVPVACWTVLRLYPPEIDTVRLSADDEASHRAAVTMSAAERRTIGLLVTMIALWIAGSWVPQLDVVVVAQGLPTAWST